MSSPFGRFGASSAFMAIPLVVVAIQVIQIAGSCASRRRTHQKAANELEMRVDLHV